MATSADSGVLGVPRIAAFTGRRGRRRDGCGYAARADSLRQAANDGPEVIERCSRRTSLAAWMWAWVLALSRQMRLVARVTDKPALAWWRCICGNDPEYEGFRRRQRSSCGLGRWTVGGRMVATAAAVLAEPAA